MSFSILRTSGSKKDNQVYRFDFDSEDALGEFWLVSQFGSFDRNTKLLKVKDGNLILYSDAAGLMPMLMSKPIDLPPGYVLTVRRKVKISRGENVFSGGFALYQTDEDVLVPKPKPGNWSSSIGEGIGLIEYSYDLFRKERRPGKNVFRFLAADWEYNDNYQLLSPIYDEWFEEEFSFDTRTDRLRYSVNGKEYYLNSYRMDKPAVRVLMHAYGLGNENKAEIDYIEITVEDKNGGRRK